MVDIKIKIQMIVLKNWYILNYITIPCVFQSDFTTLFTDAIKWTKFQIKAGFLKSEAFSYPILFEILIGTYAKPIFNAGEKH